MRPPLCSAGHVTPSAVRDPPFSYRSRPPPPPTVRRRYRRARRRRSCRRDTSRSRAAWREFPATRGSRFGRPRTTESLASVSPLFSTALARHRLPRARLVAATRLLTALSRGTRQRGRLSRGGGRPGQRLQLLARTRGHYAGDETPRPPQKSWTGPHWPLARHVRFMEPLPLAQGSATVSPALVAGHWRPLSSTASHSTAAGMSDRAYAYCTRASPLPTRLPPSRRASLRR